MPVSAHTGEITDLKRRIWPNSWFRGVKASNRYNGVVLAVLLSGPVNKAEERRNWTYYWVFWSIKLGIYYLLPDEKLQLHFCVLFFLFYKNTRSIDSLLLITISFP